MRAMEMYERGKEVLPIVADAIETLETRIAQLKADNASQREIAKVEKQLRQAQKVNARLAKTLERLKKCL